MTYSDGAWPVVELGSLLTDIQPGFASGKHNSEGQGIPHFRPMNVSVEGQVNRTVLKYIDEAIADRPERRLRRGDVVFNNTNSPELVGKTALFEGDDAPAFSNHMTRLRVDGSRLDPGYLSLRLHQAWREGWFAAHCNNHVSQASIGRDVLRGFEIELPPIDIQRAIRALGRGVEERVASCSGHVAVSRRAVERFRQAVLAAACTGRLTAAWREAHPDVASVEHALAEMQLARKPRRQKEQAVELQLPELAEGYIVSTVGECATVLEYGTSRRCDPDPGLGVSVLRMGNIQDGELDFSDLKYCAIDSEIERLLLQEGDLLFNRTNSPELVGKSAVFHSEQPASFASYLIRVRFAEELAHPDFVNYWINSAWGRAWAKLAKTDGVSQSNINGSKLALMPLPLPPLEEQQAIVERASAMLKLADGLLTRIDGASRSADRSSQAVLAKAFRGELAMEGIASK